MDNAMLTGVQIGDAYQAANNFVIAQGRNIEAGIYRVRYAPFNYAQHVNVITEGNPWAIGTTFFTQDSTGAAKFISGAANDIPFNQIIRDMKTSDFDMVGAAWEWNLQEVQQSLMNNIPLNAERSLAATQAVERLLNAIAMKGSTEKNWTGLVNSTLVTRVDAAGSGTARYWANKTADQILLDVNAALSSVQVATKEIEYADTLRLPPDAFRLIASMAYGTGNATLTVLEFLKKNNVYTAQTGQPLDIGVIRELGNASVNAGGRMMVYRKAPDVVRFHLPMIRTPIQPRQKGLMAWEAAVIARTGGTEWRMPAAAAYVDEITAPAA